MVAAAVYGVVAVCWQLATLGLVLTARAVDRDPRDAGLGSAANLRRVDADLWAGAQPSIDEYQELVDAGVRTVIDLRTGARDDRNPVDPGALRALGVDYVRLPVPDGHAPSAATVERIVQTVEQGNGRVYLHCGAGVGRSMAAQAAYLAATGRQPSWLRHMAIGPASLEQIWFAARARPGEPHSANPVVRRLSEILDAPRRSISRLRALL